MITSMEVEGEYRIIHFDTGGFCVEWVDATRHEVVTAEPIKTLEDKFNVTATFMPFGYKKRNLSRTKARLLAKELLLGSKISPKSTIYGRLNHI